MIHFYRGEMSRSNSWRQRLDATTNWAVITTGAALTFVFSDPGHTASILLIDSLFVLLFLFIEARRYRYYELWTYRVRVMEKNFFAGLLSPPFMPHADWADKITDSYKPPALSYRSYGGAGSSLSPELCAHLLDSGRQAGLGKFICIQRLVAALADFVNRASMGPIPGWFVLTSARLYSMRHAHCRRDFYRRLARNPGRSAV